MTGSLWARRAGAVTGGLAVVLVLLGCGAEPEVEPVSPDALAEAIADSVEEDYAVRPEVSCEEELPAERGAETTCEMTTEDDPDTVFPVTATVTGVDPETGHVDFDVEVSDTPSDEDGSPDGEESGSPEPTDS
ncbi:DUF4333 domain-containing protein [Georgenia alba]|uniref:DUF4333 domain-containing protein n=1 Tax=Georgenia alba TaxID=2233858 RepID=A0ABW2Q9G2_9MICO